MRKLFTIVAILLLVAFVWTGVSASTYPEGQDPNAGNPPTGGDDHPWGGDNYRPGGVTIIRPTNTTNTGLPFVDMIFNHLVLRPRVCHWLFGHSTLKTRSYVTGGTTTGQTANPTNNQ